jgi:glycosyltransferase involved in cell wall biosynthesis
MLRPERIPERPLRVLSVSTMFPSEALPVHAVFVRHRLLALARFADVRVVCPVPDFPLVARLAPKYSTRLKIPEQQVHRSPDGEVELKAYYPRHFSVPAVAKPVEGVTLRGAVLEVMDRLRKEEGFQPDVLDAHLAYPDGFGVALAAEARALPFTITLRGHDINELDRHPMRWRQVQWALSRATRVFGVCRALIDGAIAAGASPEKCTVLSNGVDPALFHSMERGLARSALGLPLEGRIVLSVGHMVERKGFHLLVDALARLRRDPRFHDVTMVFVGAAGEEGDFTPEVKARVAAHGLESYVRFEGAVRNDALFRHYAAADVFALASDKEGWPNVLFEALACGTPCVATRVWGTPECLNSEAYGLLVDQRTPEAIAQSLERALMREWDRDLLVRYARANTWTDVGRRFYAELQRAVGQYSGVPARELEARLGPPPQGPNAPAEAATP